MMRQMQQNPTSSVTFNSGDTGVFSLNGTRILVVDDDHNTLEMLSELLSSYGAEVKTAESVVLALMVSRSWRPDILISDIGMPVLDGFDLIRSILAAPHRLSMTAIAITGFSRQEDRDRALAAGYDIFLTKPVDLDQLLNSIAKIKHRYASSE